MGSERKGLKRKLQSHFNILYILFLFIHFHFYLSKLNLSVEITFKVFCYIFLNL